MQLLCGEARGQPQQRLFGHVLGGHIAGEPPFTGTLRHKGWRVDDLRLPTAIDGHDLALVAPAEVEL